MRIVWAVLAVGAVLCGPVRAATESADAARNEMIQRGEYIARAAGCVSCHSEPGGKAFAGGAALKTPFGTVYAPNITPDKSGIGGWEAEDFERAVRLGLRKDGALLYPAMPYTHYAHMSRDDMASLWSYLRLVPAISHQTPKNALSFPFTNRAALGVWQSLYYKPAAFSPQAAKGEAWNRGYYLVEALGHCDSCHAAGSGAPSAGAPSAAPGHRLTEVQIEDWYVPDITGGALTSITGKLAVHDSLSHLTDADVSAVETYLKDRPKGAAGAHAQAISTTSDENLKEGRALFERSCASCHGSSGRGQKGVAALAGDQALAARSPHYAVIVLLEGVPAHGPKGAMQGFAKSLDDQQIADVTNFIRGAWGNHGAPNATPWTVGGWRQLAQPPASAPAEALRCPALDAGALQPALATAAKLHQAARDRAALQSLVGSYRQARPQSSGGQVIEALSTAYCGAIQSEHRSPAQATADSADFALQVAMVLSQH
jgi:mono/diheme cytochrome c family protein